MKSSTTVKAEKQENNYISWEDEFPKIETAEVLLYACGAKRELTSCNDGKKETIELLRDLNITDYKIFEDNSLKVYSIDMNAFTPPKRDLSLHDVSLIDCLDLQFPQYQLWDKIHLVPELSFLKTSRVSTMASSILSTPRV